jgi:hypothetical protein
MSLVTTIADDDPAQENLGDLGKFRLGKLTKLIKPALSIAKPLMSMGKGGGLLTAMGPWGWAAGAALAVGGTAMGMAARHQRKKRLARERKQQEQAAAAAQGQPQPTDMQPMMMPGYEQPAAEGSYPSPDMPEPGAMTLPESPSSEAPVPGSDVAMPFPMTEQQPAPSVDVPEVQAVLDPEMPPPAVDGLAADGQPTAPLDWRNVAFIAGLGLGGWWLLSNHKPTHSRRR